ncbi:MAG: phosphoribosylformylglycinamidine cyclo-ligase [Planctomycetota bacterium]|jgi:phosphoribosylformylglycinamidine cyclo-ligase|nr:phosphoribosylformylglycinamidine cyclo-ligase [Planctomycetota bacterium]
MRGKKKLNYRNSGVDIDAAGRLEDGYFRLIRPTLTPGAIRNDGGYGGLLRLQGAPSLLGGRWRDPILVSGTDGVGTKLKIAFALKKHDTVGIDLVAMSVNDILVQGAEPLFFLDYVGIGKADARTLLEIVKGVAAGCRQAGCALLGGETAELPNFYAKGEYDLAGFAVGSVERKHLIDGSKVEAGDVIIGLPSSGLHSNGYSLARKALLEKAGMKLGRKIAALGCTLGEELLRPTRIYVKPILSLLAAFRARKSVHALAHITGGGIVENVPRVIPGDLDAVFDPGSWPEPPIFELVRLAGNVDREEMYRVFNMGLGMIAILKASAAEAALRHVARVRTPGFVVGRIARGRGVVRFS